MIKTISVISVSMLLVACGGAGSQSTTAEYTSAGPEYGAALPAPINAATLEVDRNFRFSTARKIDIEFDIEAARNDDATVTICTDYETVADSFDIDFNSCAISGNLVNGKFEHSMEITNDNSSVVATVLFQNPEMSPMYKEFSVEKNQRSKGDGTYANVIVWK